MTPRRLLLLLVLPLLLGKCAPASTIGPKVTAVSGFDIELASVAVIRPDRCPAGRLTLASWGALYNGPLDGSAPFVNVTQQLFDAYPTPEHQPQEWGGDELLVRLPNGDLLFARQGLIGQRPAVFTVPGTGGAPDQTFEAPVLPQLRLRGIEWFWISEDCGKKWKAHSTIDARDFFGGVCAFPRKNEDGTFLPSGWDRGELTVDPWTGKAYFVTDCDSGSTEGEGYTGRLFALEPGATEWDWSPVILPRSPPAVMTTTKSGALWLFHCVGDQPLLYRSNDGGMSFPPATALHLQLPDTDQPTCGSVQNDVTTPGKGSNELAGNQEVLVADYALSRAGDDAVRVVYPTLVNGRARLVALYAFHTAGNDELQVKPLVHRFQQEKSDASEIHQTFVERDSVAGETSEKPVSMLYWLESSPGTDQIRVRYSIVRGDANYDNAKTITAPWTPNFDPNNANWGGDYQNGAYYCKDGKMNFLAVWPEADPSVTAPNAGLTYATITVNEDC